MHAIHHETAHIIYGCIAIAVHIIGVIVPGIITSFYLQQEECSYAAINFRLHIASYPYMHVCFAVSYMVNVANKHDA